MKKLLTLPILLALTTPAALSAQDSARQPTSEAREAAPTELEPAEPQSCEITVELSAAAANEDGTLPLRGWTHVAISHRRGEASAAPTEAQVAEALERLDRDGNGTLDEEELEGHVERDREGRVFIVRLPSECRPAQR